MAYQVLARKWRPRNFDEVAGQGHVLRALSNSLAQGRLHHAYLFVGERGVGKTTLARILAKCLNCEQGVTAQPCGVCAACTEIDQGRFIDLIEVDAASRTKVEDTRELLDNVQYRPSHGRYKVYLIDEVHMLSNHSFNALLKTLEEPPEHVKFLLATTDPQKLPVTVRSRCLQFNLKRMPVAVIAAQIVKILSQEQVQPESEAVLAIARAAQGSMRDALSLLDQALSYGAGALRETEVLEMLGAAPRAPWTRLIGALAQSDVDAALAAVGELSSLAVDFMALLDELLTLLHQAALSQVSREAMHSEAADAALALRLGERLDAEALQLFYQIALIGKRDLPLAPDMRSGFEMIVLRMLRFVRAGAGAGMPMLTSERAPAARTASAPTPRPPMATPGPASTPVAASRREAAVADMPRVEEPPIRPAPAVAANEPVSEWTRIVSALGLKGITEGLARNCVLEAIEQNEVRLRIAQGHAGLATEKSRLKIQDALSAHLGRTVKLKIDVADALGAETPAQTAQRQADERIASAQESLEADPVVRNLKARFGARLIEGSVRVVDPAAKDS